MKIFEIHITGEETINYELDKLGIKNIIVKLLGPNNEFIRNEHMSSFIFKCDEYQDCKDYVDSLLDILKSKIIRVKIESMIYDEYIKDSIYIESHFKPSVVNKKYPTSVNVKSGNFMGTDRVYDKEKYLEFMEKWKDQDLELCLYDTNPNQDSDWFNLYNI